MGLKQVIVIRKDLQMGVGKACAQAAHASLEAFLKTQQKDAFVADHWLRTGAAKVALRVDSEQELFALFEGAKAAKIPASLIKDAGLTQIPPGTATAVGIGPAAEGELEPLTNKLKLL